MDNETLVRLETKFEQLLEIVQDIKNSLTNQTEKISELEKDVKKIISDVMEKFFKMMYNKRGFWKNEVSNG